MDKLAIYGGSPVREANRALSYGHQYIDEADIAAVSQALLGDLTCGPKVTEAEADICRVTGAKYCVLTANGTAALHIAAMAAGIGEGDEVITTPITFAASANCILYCKGKPVFADIRPDTYNIDPASVRSLITPRTKAVIAVDFTGQAVELNQLRAICKEYGLLLIEDASHAIGTTYEGQPIGSLSDMTTFSFHPVKTITGGEGGAVTTNDPALYEKLVLYRTHGITRDRKLMKHPTDDPWYNEQVTLGYNYRITDIQAALISSQLKKLPLFAKRRKEITAFYQSAFSSMPQLQVQTEIPESDSVRHLYILRVKPPISRRAFFDALYAEGIHTQVHYLPVYWHSYYESLGYTKGLCPNAEAYYQECFSLPLYYTLSDEDIADVVTAVKKVLAAM